MMPFCWSEGGGSHDTLIDVLLWLPTVNTVTCCGGAPGAEDGRRVWEEEEETKGTSENIRNKMSLYDLSCPRLVVSQTASICIYTASDATKCFPSQRGRWQPDHFISISYLNGRGFCISEKRWDPKSTPSFYYTVPKAFFFSS